MYKKSLLMTFNPPIQDGHEICFVGEEGFRQLSQMDPKGEEMLTEAIDKDKSDEWFTNKGGKAAA